MQELWLNSFYLRNQSEAATKRGNEKFPFSAQQRKKVGSSEVKINLLDLTDYIL